MEFTQRLFAQVLGAVLLLVGVLGYVSALAPNGMLLGLFGVNPLHNAVHVLSGLVLLGAGFYENGKHAKQTNMTFGVVYLLIAAVGMIGAVMTLLNLNAMDHGLHFLIGAAALAVAYTAKK